MNENTDRSAEISSEPLFRKLCARGLGCSVVKGGTIFTKDLNSVSSTQLGLLTTAYK